MRLRLVQALKTDGWELYQQSSPNDQANLGFEYRAFKNKSGTVILSFGGTNEPKDFAVDGRNAWGYYTEQYNLAITVARNMKEKVAKDGGKLFLTGHSLGAGLAETAGIVNKIPAVTFNAAAPHEAVLKKYGATRDAEIARTSFYSFRIQGEILSNSQAIGVFEGAYLLGGLGAFLAGTRGSNGIAAETTWLPPPRGKEVSTMFVPPAPGFGLGKELVREGLGYMGLANGRLELHYMESVDASLAQELSRVQRQIREMLQPP
jgi:hypothetical protein